MKIVRISKSNFDEKAAEIAATSSLFDPAIEKRVRDILVEVARRGDRALVEFTRKFDGVKLPPSRLRVTEAEIESARRSVSPQLKKALEVSSRNVAAFARKSLRKNWSATNAQGAKVGEKFDPFQRVGIYVPGGAAPLISTAVMTLTLAKVAGCPEIVVCTPCGPGGKINDDLLYAIAKSGATEIYRVGGAQAIGALALGTSTIRPVQKIYGPGNAYVVAAKRMLVGHVAIDLLPGPSELLVLADGAADPRFIAADLLAQAEHGSGHERVFLVSTSMALIQAVRKEMTRQLPTLLRQRFIEKTLDNTGMLIHVRSIDQGVALANRIAPEHCEVMTENAASVSKGILTAGAIFLGHWSPTALGDYVAGPSHVLPTGGAGASFPGLTVDQFQRRTSVVAYSPPSLQKSLSASTTLARLEGLDAHARSVEIRAESLAPASKRKKRRS